MKRYEELQSPIPGLTFLIAVTPIDYIFTVPQNIRSTKSLSLHTQTTLDAKIIWTTIKRFDIMKRPYKVFVINSGSTSTIIALFKGEHKIYQKNVDHDVQKLKELHEIRDQLPMHMEAIESAIGEDSLDLNDVDTFAARCDRLVSISGLDNTHGLCFA